MKWMSVAVVVGVVAFPVAEAAAFDVSFFKEKAKALVGDAQKCAKQMADIGFYFDEIRTELDLTPKIELFFRDGGAPAGAAVPSTIAGSCHTMAKMLLAGRQVEYGGYRLKGVKLTLPSPKVELIHVIAP